jgi:hypothetical protein
LKRKNSTGASGGAKRGSSGKKPIEQYEHKDKKRANIPPVGLVTPETDPIPTQARKHYAYDPHLDPQLVWAGKSERTSFEIPTVTRENREVRTARERLLQPQSSAR